MLDDDTWQSTPSGKEWLWFPRQRYYSFDIKALGGRTPEVILPYVSATADPNASNRILGAGNIAEIFHVGPNHVDIKNDTCSDYYLRLILKVTPLPPETRPDASSSAESDADIDDMNGGVNDAATDAGQVEAGF